MQIDSEKCIGCGRCSVFCIMDCISLVPRDEAHPGKGKRYAVIDDHECVECGCCQRGADCPTDALTRPELVWPRTVRAVFSDPIITFEETGVKGRGTEEMKTNDVTGRFKPGRVGLACELGRPGIGARLRDLGRLAEALAKVDGLGFEKANPVTSVVMADPATGAIKPELADEKVVSGIIEADLPLEKLTEALEIIEKTAPMLDTVFSLDVICLPDENGGNPALEMIKKTNFTPRFNGKTNLGLGRVSNPGVEQ